MYTLILYKKFSFRFACRRKCDIEPRDRDSKSIMEPRDLSSSARLFPNAQIKIRWVDVVSRLESETNNFIISFIKTTSAHLPQLRRRQIHLHPHLTRGHQREIKDYPPRAVFMRNQLQGSRALPLLVDTRHQYI